jgi:putative PIN family toxin of toxin-antitoxin system
VKVILDTSVIVESLISSSDSNRCQSIIKILVQKQIELCVSKETFDELLSPKVLKSHHQKMAKFKAWYKYSSVFYKPTTQVTICRDPKDNMFLELALESQAQYLISSDKDLLSIQSFNNTTIIHPLKFYELVK